MLLLVRFLYYLFGLHCNNTESILNKIQTEELKMGNKQIKILMNQLPEALRKMNNKIKKKTDVCKRNGFSWMVCIRGVIIQHRSKYCRFLFFFLILSVLKMTNPKKSNNKKKCFNYLTTINWHGNTKKKKLEAKIIHKHFIKEKKYFFLFKKTNQQYTHTQNTKKFANMEILKFIEYLGSFTALKAAVA